MRTRQRIALFFCFVAASLTSGCASNKPNGLSADEPTKPSFISFQFRVHDGTAYSDDAYVMTVDVAPVQDAPTASNTSITSDEDTPYVFAVGDFHFHDVDGDPMTQIQVTSLGSAGSLKLGGMPVGLNDVIMTNDIDAGNLTFEPDPETSGAGYSSFSFAVHDGTEYSVTHYTTTINVNAVNDAPVSADQYVSLNEADTYTFRSTDFPFTDSDSDGMSQVQIVSLQGPGSLKLNGLNVLANDEITLADLNAGTLTFEPAPATADPTAAGPSGFQFTVHDGSTYSTEVYTMTVDVVSPNQLPTAADSTVVMSEDTAYVFTPADFQFSDPDGDGMKQIQITSLDHAGKLELDSREVSLNEVISFDQIASGRLVFESIENAAGTDHGRFSYRVHDGKGYSDSSYTMTININAVNDAPTSANNTVSTAEDTVYVFTPEDFHFTDVDGDPIVQIQITSVDLIGGLKLNGVDVAIDDVISIEDIRAGNLIFVPQSDWNGSVDISFSASDTQGRTAPSATLTMNVSPVGTTSMAIQPDNAR